jgi:hypothetical protein
VLELCQLKLGDTASIIYPTATHLGGLVRHSPYAVARFDERKQQFCSPNGNRTLRCIRQSRAHSFTLVELLRASRTRAECTCTDMAPLRRACCARVRVQVASSLFDDE